MFADWVKIQRPPGLLTSGQAGEPCTPSTRTAFARVKRLSSPSAKPIQRRPTIVNTHPAKTVCPWRHVKCMCHRGTLRNPIVPFVTLDQATGPFGHGMPHCPFNGISGVQKLCPDPGVVLPGGSRAASPCKPMRCEHPGNHGKNHGRRNADQKRTKVTKA